MPVFPDVASRIIFPGASFPELSPSKIMLSAGRSLTEPPGLNHSALAQISTLLEATMLRRRRRGVLPTSSHASIGECARLRIGSVVPLVALESILMDSRIALRFVELKLGLAIAGEGRVQAYVACSTVPPLVKRGRIQTRFSFYKLVSVIR